MFEMTSEEHEMARADQKIAAIKSMRERTGLGLKECKDGYEENYPLPQIRSPSRYNPTFFANEHRGATTIEVHIEGYNGDTFDVSLPTTATLMPQVITFLLRSMSSIPQNPRTIRVRKVTTISEY